MADNQSSADKGIPNTDDNQVTVDEYMNWAATFDNLPPELQYIVLKQAGARLIEGGSRVLMQAHEMLLEKTRVECDEKTLSEQVMRANYSVFARNKPAYIAAGIAILVCVCVAVYKISKVISHGIL
ncbi:hypothetical protein V8Z74_15040 [Comamonas sp. w2-DMI]|uniref:hypothetical protein n=1 Tax=Comamonas sp. w2-DMI TaxID=3126391 RepID=UPI0032E36EC0